METSETSVANGGVAVSNELDVNNEETRSGDNQVEIVDLTASSSPVKPVDIISISSMSQQPTQGTQELNATAEPTNSASTDEKGNQRQLDSDDDSSSDSDDDSEMVDDSGITLNLEEGGHAHGREHEVIAIDSSSDSEEVEKGRSKRPRLSEPFAGSQSGAVQPAKPSGAVAVSTSLKLGKSARSAIGSARITRKPLSEAIRDGSLPIEVVDYSTPGSTAASSSHDIHDIIGLSPALSSTNQTGKGEIEVIDLLSDPVEISVEDLRINSSAPTASQSKVASEVDNQDSDSDSDSESEEEEEEDDGMIKLDTDDDEDEGAVSENESGISSVDTGIWALQQRYYVRQVSPPLLHEESRMYFGADISAEEAVRRTLQKMDKQSLPKKRKICDICLEPHLTNNCDKTKCDVCKSSHEHFSFNCPYKTSKYKSELPICNVPLGQKDFEIWRIMPENIHPNIRKPAKIPMACYSCGDDNHFGDDCPAGRKRGYNISSESIWNAKSASKWTTMNMDSKYIKSSKKKTSNADEAEDPELSWFEVQIKQAKSKVPDADLSKEYMEERNNRPPQQPRPRQERGYGGDRRPNIQMNIPSRMSGQGPSSAGGMNTFTNFRPQGLPPAPRRSSQDDSYRPSHDDRARRPPGHDRGYSPQPYGEDRRPSYGRNERGGRGSQYEQQGQNYNRGPPPPQPRGYHAVPPPPSPNQYQPPPPQYPMFPPPAPSHQEPQSSGGSTWSLPSSIRSSTQPPLPPAPPPGPGYSHQRPGRGRGGGNGPRQHDKPRRKRDDWEHGGPGGGRSGDQAWRQYKR
ncbi:hypothetical protein ABW19_dt0204896 [Dactylella cylindrospora]|nr:hypothetical protein ABW19_dt0204896 [Dactylella cylindrospora]